MRVLLVHNPSLIYPLEAPARNAWLLDRTIGEMMERELLSAGLTIVRAGNFAEAEELARQERTGAFILSDSVACSRIVLRRFIRSAEKRRGSVSVVCSLPTSHATDFASHVDGLNPTEGGAPSKKVWTAPIYFLRGN